MRTTTNGSGLRGLAVAVHSLVQRMRRLQLNDPVDRATMAVLWRVSEHGNPRPSVVASDLGLDLSTISRHVQALDAEGYLCRTPDPHDRRACRLSLTASGAELVQQAWERRIAAITAAVEHWELEDRETLTRLITRLTDDLTDPRHGNPEGHRRSP